ncbi:hypothetical protein SAMN05444344_1655 [Tenacibaculum mesophilum]|uniref:Uncharacterized protein n=1 Tax=Tenacibaculum mesophilum TaxID=104268 RepID=A0ABM7CDL2_9FLAO|nr:hypothetical protein [Tenacibaculum mesophilum]AZJ31825.1 hypothetical protein D6200_04280 [Tenacibaculum mesophilum]QFS27080.1 hypothetical protein F9Y86_01150 [Tenacibaculum mesophilum]SHF84392.1 hypothetical protein SAMN05444344_1655 [Tenacibaculum mesophilum]
MKTKVLNLGTIISKTAQKQILGGESPMRCPGDGVLVCKGEKPHTNCWCYYKAYEVLRPE